LAFETTPPNRSGPDETKKQKRLLEAQRDTQAHPPAHHRPDDGGFITGPGLCRRYGVSEQSIWRWRRDPALGFPPSMLINRRNYWRLADLIEWERHRARRDVA
jgi:predicted DNA-binding transcriptional regulator AlpA